MTLIEEIIYKGAISDMAEWVEPEWLTYERDDIRDSEADIIIHQVNCVGVSGDGVGRQLNGKFKGLRQDYLDHLDSFHRPRQALGTYKVFLDRRTGQLVANVVGQFGYGTDKQYTNYAALDKAFNKLSKTCVKFGLSIGMPYHMGCGCGGGEWSEVISLVEKNFINKGVKVLIHKPKR